PDILPVSRNLVETGPYGSGPTTKRIGFAFRVQGASRGDRPPPAAGLPGGRRPRNGDELPDGERRRRVRRRAVAWRCLGSLSPPGRIARALGPADVRAGLGRTIALRAVLRHLRGGGARALLRGAAGVLGADPRDRAASVLRPPLPRDLDSAGLFPERADRRHRAVDDMGRPSRGARPARVPSRAGDAGA